MRSKNLVLCGMAVLLLSVPAAAAAAPCCDQADFDVVNILMTLDSASTVATPDVQATEVWFQRPVVIDRKILQGRYVIEHDNARMARGEPCTFIYAYNDRKNPVVTFHCKHLVRGEAPQNIAVLATNSEGWQKLLEFQFKGETTSHGVPTER